MRSSFDIILSKMVTIFGVPWIPNDSLCTQVYCLRQSLFAGFSDSESERIEDTFGTAIYIRQGVNFINVKRARFLYECCFGSFFFVHRYVTYVRTYIEKKPPKWRSYEKCARITLMKLTTRIQAVDGNIINLLNPLSNSALHRGPICWKISPMVCCGGWLDSYRVCQEFRLT